MTDSAATERSSAGQRSDLDDDRCTPTACGRAIVVPQPDGQTPRAFSARCLHVGAPLFDAWVGDGAVVCPHHFWRYDVSDGSLIGSDQPRGLEEYPVHIIDGEVLVELPAPEPPRSIREQQLDHAKTWRRGDES